MTLISYSKITDGSTVDASDVNTPLDTIYNDHNGGIDSTNLADNAVTTAKITDANVTTAKIDFTTFPDMQSWSPTVVGFSTVPSGAAYYYTKVGRQVTLYISQPNNGTSNSSSFTISLPFTAATISGFMWAAPVVQPIDNGSINTTNSGIALISSGATAMTLLSNAGGATWTASGGKRIPYLQISYLSIS